MIAYRSMMLLRKWAMVGSSQVQARAGVRRGLRESIALVGAAGKVGAVVVPVGRGMPLWVSSPQQSRSWKTASAVAIAAAVASMGVG